MIYLSQRDPAWSTKKMGISTESLGRYGCTTTCISMLSSYFECYLTPLQLASNTNLYTKNGLIIWSRLKFDKMRFVKRERGRNDAGIRNALADPDDAVILEVDNHSHWVVAIRKSGNDYVILDPWTGKKGKAIKDYRNITGAAYFSRKGFAEPAEVHDPKFAKALALRPYPFFLQTEQHGELWFMHEDGERSYLSPSNILDFMKEHATGISDKDLSKIPIKK